VSRFSRKCGSLHVSQPCGNDDIACGVNGSNLEFDPILEDGGNLFLQNVQAYVPPGRLLTIDETLAPENGGSMLWNLGP
jgi:hypothetical protein